MTTNLYLIRHGESLAQVQDTTGDPGLTPLGVKQAEHLRDRLAATREIAADILIASTYLRAKQTAEILAPGLGLPIIFDDEVQELRGGEAEGMSQQEFRQKFGEVDFENNPLKPVAPGGENLGQFQLRVGTALNRITRQHEGKTIVVVCHGGIIDGSFLYFFGLSTLQVPQVRFYTHNASITHWEKSTVPGLSKPRWRLVKYNDDIHLRDIDTPLRIPWKELSSKPVVGADQPTIPVETDEWF